LRVAVIADIHGNLVALDTVLAAIGDDNVDEIICLGDIAATGPQPREVIQRLERERCWCVMGNADAELLQPIPAPAPDEPRWLAIDRWCAAQIGELERDSLSAFAPSLEVDLDDGVILLAFHGSPASFDDQIVATTPDAELDAFLTGYSATIFAGGHTHEPFVRSREAHYMLNPGSVGLRPPSATYALIDVAEGQLDIRLRQLRLDVQAVLDAAAASGMPELDWWSSYWTSPNTEG
jgi:predicted phosphodiesterase